MSNMQLDTLRRIVQEINASTSLHESLRDYGQAGC